ncbi:hypothetical protein DLM75_21390 [Leptospira stimsonii]|uniref:Uncharacterized protein n=1 Tax=Leptospira stimsonii TaxID=2202203 RepID=A0A396YSF1_9LEPT|nr:hypothetical protein DLM75_21390 [Leptospira stimsonii]
MVYPFLRIRLPIFPSGNSYGGIWRTSKKSLEIDSRFLKIPLAPMGFFALYSIVSLCQKFFHWSALKMSAVKW